MNKSLSAACLWCGLVSPVQADDTAVLQYLFWDLDISGYVEDGDSRLNFRDDLNVEPRQKKFYALRWDTGASGWPDLAAAYTPIDAEGRRTTASDGGLLGLPIGTGGATALVDADIDDWELSLSYPWRLGSGAISGGLTLKKLDGEVLILEEGQSAVSREEIDQTFPAVHLAFSAPLGPRLEFSGAGNYVRYEGDQVHDWRLSAALRLGPATLSGGWQERRYQVQNQTYDFDARLSGAFAGLGLVF